MGFCFTLSFNINTVEYEKTESEGIDVDGAQGVAAVTTV